MDDFENIKLNDMDLSGFDLDSSQLDLDFNIDIGNMDFSIADENRYHFPPLHKKVKKRAVLYDHAENLIDEIGDRVLEGETCFCLLSGNFIFGDLFEAFATKKHFQYNDITLSTLSISQDNVDSLHNLIYGNYLNSLNIIVSDYFWSHNRQNAPYIYQSLDIADKFQLAVAGTHTKITLLNIEDKKIVITGSANLRSSRSIEEITIQTDSSLYDFHKKWHDEILKEYGTINKAIRASKLYDFIVKNTEDKKQWEVK